MHAAGFLTGPNASQPKSIQTKTVILRLGVIIPEFDQERQNDATFLVGLRNQELHSSASPLGVDTTVWLPQFTRVVEVICRHLGVGARGMLGRELLAQGRALIDRADKKLEHEISQRIAKAKDFLARLRPDEASTRKASIQRRGSDVVVNCPACNERIPIVTRSARSTNERLEGDVIVRDVVYVATELVCPVCDLELNDTAEIRAAGVEQQYVRQEEDSIEDRFLSTWEPDYGND
jgi:hypothetical protein